MVLEFHELEYHGKLDFAKLEYLKSDKSLHISETVIDCNIVCKNVLFDYFRGFNFVLTIYNIWMLVCIWYNIFLFFFSFFFIDKY